ncbi:hypothetical protein HNO88_001651 [Novosphingobium chloroacetimidivorans]|uniref:Permease n=1 Tax=Novosphingobium chloroacetimidivorans TaxID=1428314 RepID=A0A7W7K8R4_9SPHN|nr:hypothetical protein [Novosphingobium chloroacetimidivorans]MBB4858332.1 hypothetical protein [Novosphingobium chloroacetimidivorans]
MDFMKWLNSLDEFLFEVMSWLVFFPLTLWRTLVQPLEMMAYADAQLALPEDEQYAAAVSPPLFLALALLIAHGLSTALGQTDAIIANRHGLAALVDSETSALLLRLVAFATIPLVMSVQLLRRRGVKIVRGTLRLPFYGQCYPAAAFALMLSLGTTLGSVPHRSAHIASTVLTMLAFLYFLAAETRWFMAQLSIKPLRAFGAAAMGLLEGFALLLLVGFLFTR